MQLTRRTFLRAAGVSLALPWLDALAPAQGQMAVPRRMLCICTPLGLHPANFFPQAAGRDYTLTPYLEPFREMRNDFTVISGLAHPDTGASHDSIYNFLTAAPHPERRAGFRNSVSLDQVAAVHIGDQTRFPSLALSCEGFSLSWTRSGALVPSDSWPSGVFARLFLEGRPDERAAQVRRLRDGRSILDAVGEQAKSLFQAASSPATATSSTNTSAACANLNAACRSRRNGRAGHARASMSRRRRTTTTRPTWSARPA